MVAGEGYDGGRLSEVVLGEVPKPQVKFLSCQSNPSYVKMEKMSQRRQDSLPSTKYVGRFLNHG